MDRYSAPSIKITPISLLCFGLILFAGFMLFQKSEYPWPDSKPVPHLQELLVNANYVHVRHVHLSKLEKTRIRIDFVRITPAVSGEKDPPDVEADPALFRQTKAEACSQALADATFDYEIKVANPEMDTEAYRAGPASFVFNSRTGRLFDLNRPADCGQVSPAFQKHIVALQEKSRKATAQERAANLEQARRHAIADLHQQIQQNRARYQSHLSEQEGEAIYMGEGKIKILRGPVLLSRPVDSGTN